MAYDLVIKNGTIVDGSGMPAYRADVGIKDGKIIEKGRINGGKKTIDAAGKIVAPGFIDIHTHYDAQILWDPLLISSPWHGFTTAIMGNCGFTLAPCLPRDRDYIVRMFSRVEGINITALQKGIDWQWESFPEYLHKIGQTKIGINVATMVGHSAVRRFVLGEEANKRQASAAEIQQMKGLVREAMAAGAFGFTTSLSPTHFGWDGQPIPSRLASYEEVIELGSTLSEFSIGSIEIITESAVIGPDRFSEADQKLMTALSLRSGRPVNWNELSHSWDRPTVWRNQIEYMRKAALEGAQVYAVARCQRGDPLFNLKSLTTFDVKSPIGFKWPQWQSALTNAHEKRMALLKDPATRVALLAEARQVDATATPDWRRVAKLVLAKSVSGKYAKFENMTLGEIGRQVNKAPEEILLDWSVEEGLDTEFFLIGARNGDPEAAAEILRSPFSLAGISDAGAHTDRHSGAYFSTYLLTHWVREKGALTLEEAIRRLTFMPASIYGIRDRGLLREGMAADIVIFDLDKLAWLPRERVNDFPGGEPRLIARSLGYEYLIVNGQLAFTDNKASGALSGRLLKSTDYRQASN